ncbi:hypothetical protein F511_41137 [Dorcoceras hygrometricum]|uniref:Uncharacterized protein n=1 Tax=Dorcoceras hygrometricum TaxID=472368 RepID=A0A2Z7BT71_9LAMI|nr:hypothetical protein F511_41137 [Dorcoceras hygrometricum]
MDNKSTPLINHKNLDQRGHKWKSIQNVHRHARPSAGVELRQLAQRLRLRIGVFKHPEQVFEQDHLAADGDRVPVTFGAPPFDELSEQRVLHDVGGYEVAPPGLPDVDRVEVLRGGGALVVGGRNVGGGYGAGVGAAELEGLHLFEDGLDLGKLSSFGHWWDCRTKS